MKRTLVVCGRHAQRGTTLIVALIVLMLVMIQALASFTAADAQLRNAGSLQGRRDAQAAAQLAIAGLLESSAFASSGSSLPGAIDVDIDDDGVADHRVALSATCTGARAVTAVIVPATRVDDLACLAAATAGGDIPCADTRWDLRAIATRIGSAMQAGASVEIHQGVAMRLEGSAALRACPAAPSTIAVANGTVALSMARRKTYWYLRPGG